jgi:VCBS repeat-containing protein
VAEGVSASSYDLLTGATDVDVGDILSVTNLAYAVDSGTISASAPAGLTYNAVTHSLTIDPSNPAFDHLAAGVNQTIVASYNVTDANGGSVPQTATFTITGTNDAAGYTADKFHYERGPRRGSISSGATKADVGEIRPNRSLHPAVSRDRGVSTPRA